ncbi:MAG: hypothetical protein ATN31_11140 [Candidatus Epulonipiscioides saccharophilum]|nr:MAG: hypothetical protein ATN31_11140 [Epulopiscium sp. AS2M-Bin001]
MSKKLIVALMMSMFLIGCSGSEETSNTETIEVVESNKIVEKVDSSTTGSEKIEEKTVVVKTSLFEKRTENIEMHVYGAEVPWGEVKTDLPEGSYTSIATALNNAIDGDTIIVHEGVYREALNIKKDNLVIKNYEDDYVLVTGSEIVTGWTPATDHPTPGVMMAPAHEKWAKATTDYTQVFANGVMGEMAKHPNRTNESMMNPSEKGSGFDEVSNIFKNANEPGNVTFNNGLPDVDLTGGIFRGAIGKAREYPRGIIVGNEGDTVQFQAVNTQHWTLANTIPSTYHKFGFASVMHKNLIDVPNEWYLEDDILYYLPEDGQKMEDLMIEMQVREKVLIMNNVENILIEGINFKSGNADINNVKKMVVDECSFRYLHPVWLPTQYGQNQSNPTGIEIINSTDNVFKNTYVAHNWGNGISVVGGKGNTFTNCIIEDIGWIGIFTAGIMARSDDTRIEDCTFRENGRFQVRFEHHGKVDIIHNEFIGAMSMTEDAGAISSESSGWIGPLNMKDSEIAYNKIHDVKGVPVSSGGYFKQFMLGIYLEDIENYTAHHNLIYDIVADNYETEIPGLLRSGAMLYIGPRYNAMHNPVRFYNNTAWNVDKLINMWSIVIANHEELLANGLTQEEDRGLISNGHFANNIMPTGEFDINHISQNLTANGAKINNVALEGPTKSLITKDMDEFFEHVSTVGYQLNPENNYTLDPEKELEYFVDPDNGDFNLREDSPAYQGGVVIEGITSSDNPDAGALEGGGYVLTAGSTLEIPKFKEIIE